MAKYEYNGCVTGFSEGGTVRLWQPNVLPMPVQVENGAYTERLVTVDLLVSDGEAQPLCSQPEWELTIDGVSMSDGIDYVTTITDTNLTSNAFKDATLEGREEAIMYAVAPIHDGDIYRVYIPDINVNVGLALLLDIEGEDEPMPFALANLRLDNVANTNKYDATNPFTGVQIAFKEMPIIGEHVDFKLINNQMIITSPDSYEVDDLVIDLQSYIDMDVKIRGFRAQIWSNYADAFLTNGTQPYYDALPAVKIERIACAT